MEKCEKREMSRETGHGSPMEGRSRARDTESSCNCREMDSTEIGFDFGKFREWRLR